MADKYTPLKGVLKNSSSPATVANAQHHDRSGTQRNLGGSPGTLKEVIADSTVETAVEDYAILRVTNTDTAVHFLVVDESGALPAAAFGTAFALPAGKSEIFYMGKLASGKSIAVKTDNSAVQIAIIEG